MIVIVATFPRERAALAALCDAQGWQTAECDSVRAAVRLFHHGTPKIVLTRYELADGYSDDIIAALIESKLLPITKVIVLMGAGAPSTQEARQLALGADCVQRDPVRSNVLLAYLAKYWRTPNAKALARQTKSRSLVFCGGRLNVLKRTIEYHRHRAVLTPREISLAEWLIHTRGDVITYETLYREILGRRFQGDTSNMRVLLQTLAKSTATVGIALRRWVAVIPKTGYSYRAPAT